MAKILQFNANHARAAHELMEVTAMELGIDILVVSEPYLRFTQNRSDWLMDEDGLAAIKVRNPRLAITRVDRGSGFVAVSIKQIGTVFSCYVSPNISDDEYAAYIQRLDDHVGRTQGQKLVGGDFNGKSSLWNSPIEDSRGRIAAEWVESRDFVVINTGDVPTYSRSNSDSILDITLASAELARRIADWRVCEEESMSDHRHITYQIVAEKDTEQERRPRNIFRGWNVNKADPEAFRQEWAKLTTGRCVKSPEQLQELLTKCCDASMPRKRAPGKRGPVYWWNAEIADQRAICTRARRVAKRATDEDSRRAAQEIHREQKRKLKKMIRKSKERCWQAVCLEVEHDVWGLGYKIVMRKLKRDVDTLDIEEKKTEYSKLFPTHQDIEWTLPTVRDLVPYTKEELLKATSKMKSGKAPGRDRIPTEAVKMAVAVDPDTVLRVMNGVLESGVFPEDWKVSKLVLVPKGPKRAGAPRAYRPICLLSVLGKLQERLIGERLMAAIEASGGLSPKQFGFLRGKSTTDAMKEVLKVALREKAMERSKRRFCVLVTLDIKNAFNSVSWLRIVMELRRRGIPDYLMRILQSYPENRWTELEEGVMEGTNAGVPQGSVLGPLLWNIFYDGVLRIHQPEGVELVAFADDLALLVTAETENLLEERTNDALETIHKWMDGNDIEMAPQKTEAVLLIGKKRCREVTFTIGEHLVRPVPRVKYLGVIFDQKLRFADHVRYVADKAKNAAMAVTRLMPKLGGASDSKRRILAGVMDSIILYAPEVWKEALSVKKYRQQIETLERRVALRICGAYRTTSTEALRVISCRIPLVLLAEERTRPKDNEGENRRLQTHREWQELWDRATVGRWTHRLIRRIEPWFERKHGSTNRYLTQFLAGHGCFRKYLHRFRISEDATCLYCEEAEDDAEHAVFECSHFEYERRQLPEAVRPLFTPDRVIECMLESEEGWNACANVICTIVREKERDDRRRCGLAVTD